MLPRFDGRPTPEVVTEIALTTGLKINPSLLRKLVDFEILGPVEGSENRVPETVSKK